MLTHRGANSGDTIPIFMLHIYADAPALRVTRSHPVQPLNRFDELLTTGCCEKFFIRVYRQCALAYRARQYVTSFGTTIRWV